MKYEELFMEIRYSKPRMELTDQNSQAHSESVKKIATYKLIL